jgi:hypothetical protein
LICQHLKDAADPAPRTPFEQGCPQCAEGGFTDWVHLRLCLNCGLVACCDSSPRRHMSKHWEQEGHPVMRSFELGESWRWCFEDDVIG